MMTIFSKQILLLQIIWSENPSQRCPEAVFELTPDTVKLTTKNSHSMAFKQKQCEPMLQAWLELEWMGPAVWQMAPDQGYLLLHCQCGLGKGMTEKLRAEEKKKDRREIPDMQTLSGVQVWRKWSTLSTHTHYHSFLFMPCYSPTNASLPLAAFVTCGPQSFKSFLGQCPIFIPNHT